MFFAEALEPTVDPFALDLPTNGTDLLTFTVAAGISTGIFSLFICGVILLVLYMRKVEQSGDTNENNPSPSTDNPPTEQELLKM
jgi:hypothetical protein